MTAQQAPDVKPCPWPSFNFDHKPHVWHTNRKGEPIAERDVNRWSVAYSCDGKAGAS